MVEKNTGKENHSLSDINENERSANTAKIVSEGLAIERNNYFQEHDTNIRNELLNFNEMLTNFYLNTKRYMKI